MYAIEINDVSKKYKIFNEKNVTLKEKILYFGKSKPQEFSALNNISLKIEKGKTVGLIGRNGSGKSTLLKLLTRIIYPTSGTIKMDGKISSLLELGAGFHPDFTGRENIYMNASILGFTKAEIDERLDEIIAFSELGEFIDNSVRSYSSGMYMRLGFSVAIMVNPDILLIDEVLAVGDALFQKKCFEKLEEMKTAGKTIVFVSHDHGAVKKLCDEVVWIHEGDLMDIGEPEKIIGKYLAFLNKEDNSNIDSNNISNHELQIHDGIDVDGSQQTIFTDIKWTDSLGEVRHSFIVGEDILLSITLNPNIQSLLNVTVQADLYKDSILCFKSQYPLNDVNEVMLKIKQPNLNKGEYQLILTLIDKESGDLIDKLEKILIINAFNESEGLIELDHSWKPINKGV
ncbi:polysaccharide ABC transporter ATP-binding protein [Paenibacillus ginsengihumi]|uniref:ABC transporter ATP-binding protein n=1 Tax=Paenibacillus ginsengihumi TaxID=431596 RepID=UPI000362E8A3|nr:polysaccharide ABC transporter ATP-binding protein [Paenibacillus ginsengihumi]